MVKNNAKLLRGLSYLQNLWKIGKKERKDEHAHLIVNFLKNVLIER
jgi:hypothetical protein